MITEFKLFENTENTLNSKNQKIYLTNKGIENFWKWFDGSKVVDKDGKPLVLYHGTKDISDFDDFNTSNFKKRGEDKESLHDKFLQYGTFFSSSINTANLYSTDYDKPTDDYTNYQKKLDDLLDLATKDIENRVKYFTEWNKLYKKQDWSELHNNYHKGVVYSVYLSIKNPLIVDGNGKSWFKIIPDIFNKKLKNGNYDGIIIKNIIERDDIQDTYVVFSPHQIKSTIGNNGDFSKNKISINEHYNKI
jgi:hypothetical protein